MRKKAVRFVIAENRSAIASKRRKIGCKAQAKMKIQEYLIKHIQNRLGDHKALLVYDPEGLYRDMVMGLAGDSVAVIDAGSSTILGRESAMEAWCRLVQDHEDKLRLAVYLPTSRPLTKKEQQEDPYQIFALGGGVFPSGDGESYQALCRQAAPDLAPQGICIHL